MRRRRRPFRILLGCATVAIVVVVAVGLLLYRGTQHVPQFYEQALASKLTPRQIGELGDDFERDVLELHNDARREGAWEAVFSDDEVNAWLANDLPQNHPRALPEDLGDPRVNIAPDGVQVAIRYSGEPLETVVSLTTDIYLTDKPNQLAVRIRSVRAGLVPLPLKQLLDLASEVARRNGVQLVWGQQEGDPVALLQIPSQMEGSVKREIHVETLELRDGEVYLAGRTERSSTGD